MSLSRSTRLEKHPGSRGAQNSEFRGVTPRVRWYNPYLATSMRILNRSQYREYRQDSLHGTARGALQRLASRRRPSARRAPPLLRGTRSREGRAYLVTDSDSLRARVRVYRLLLALETDVGASSPSYLDVELSRVYI